MGYCYYPVIFSWHVVRHDKMTWRQRQDMTLKPEDWIRQFRNINWLEKITGQNRSEDRQGASHDLLWGDKDKQSNVRIQV